MLNSFPPLLADAPKVLILGSMPSKVSLEKNEYYGYSKNRFWMIMQEYFQREFHTYTDKKNCLYEHHIMLWDVIASCEREGSLDSAIRQATCNNIEQVIKQYPTIRVILCNGKKSYSLLQKYFQDKITIPCICMPSTSNANCTIKKEELFQQWFLQLDHALCEKGG